MKCGERVDGAPYGYPDAQVRLVPLDDNTWEVVAPWWYEWRERWYDLRAAWWHLWHWRYASRSRRLIAKLRQGALQDLFVAEVDVMPCRAPWLGSVRAGCETADGGTGAARPAPDKTNPLTGA